MTTQPFDNDAPQSKRREMLRTMGAFACGVHMSPTPGAFNLSITRFSASAARAASEPRTKRSAGQV